MKRKFLSLILVFAMTVSLLTVGTGAVEPTYGDTAGHWAESSIERWSGHGIIQGSNGLFDPNGQLTCAQLATILAKLLKLPAAKDAGFTDNTADAWYYDAINRCAAAGILNGNGDGTVTPEAPITRERAMVMLARALGIEPIRKPDLTKYTDAAQVSAYAQGYVAALIEAGIVGGVTADELAPQDNINRASTVTILDRAISTYADKAGATVKADGKGLVLVVADDVTVTGNVDKLLVPADNVDVTVSGSKNIDDITVTGDNSKVILNNSTANDVTLDGKNTELETKGSSKVENVSVTEDAKGATVNAGSGTTVKNVENSAADTTVTGSGTVKNVASDTDITVETKNTNVENSGDSKITVTDAKGKDSTVSATGSGSSTVVNKETTSSGGGYSHSHSYDTSKWVFDDTTHWHASTCGHNLKIDEAAHTYNKNDVCTVCGQVKVDVAVAKIGSKNYKMLPEAVAAAVNGDTVTLVKDCDISTSGLVISASKSITLDLGGKVIKATNTENGNILVYGTLTLADSSDKTKDGSGTGKIYTDTVYTGDDTGKCVINAQAGGTFVMESGLIDTASAIDDNEKEGQFAVGMWNDTAEAKVVINGGKIKAGWYCVAGNGQSATYDGEIIINGGILESVADYAVYLPHKGTTTVNGGVIYGEAGGVAVRCGMLKVNGGTITSKGTGSTGTWGDGTGGLETAAINVEAKYGISTVEITGGTFIAEQNALLIKNDSYESSISITGGAFSSDPSKYVAEGYFSLPNENSTYTVVTADQITSGVTIQGIAGYEHRAFATVEDAFTTVKTDLKARCGLAEESMNEAQFNAFFTENGKITWTVYGEQDVTDSRTFSFGRAANRFGESRHITEINIIGGNDTAALNLSAVNGTFALPYNWWNVEDSANTALKCKNIKFNGIKSMPSGTYQCTLHSTTYEFDGCTFNGNLYSYQDFDVVMTIMNCTFNAPDKQTQYAFMSQGKGGTITLDKNNINGYTRGVNFQRATAVFIFTNNTITSTVSEPDRAAIQLTDGKSFTVTGNTVRVNAGNAFWFHEAAKNSDVKYTISGNDIDAPYIGYYATSFDVNPKITSSDNIFNSTDTTRCMKKEATEATDTNLTAIK